MCLLLLFIVVKEEAEANYEVSFKVRCRDKQSCCFKMPVIVVVYNFMHRVCCLQECVRVLLLVILSNYRLTVAPAMVDLIKAVQSECTYNGCRLDAHESYRAMMVQCTHIHSLQSVHSVHPVHCDRNDAVCINKVPPVWL